MYTGYINKEVRAMYGIPYNQLTDEQKAILHADSKRRAKLIKEREEAVLKNNLKAFDDEAKMEKFLASLYKSCQKQILADVAETVAKVQKEGGTWSYANQSALTRSRGLFEQIQQELTKLGQAEEVTFREGLGNIYTDQFLRQVYTLGQTITVNANFNRLNPALVRKTLDYPWSGAMFSDRIWLDKEQLGKNLRLGLTQSMILGEDMAHISQRINKNIDTSEYNAMRLARTETKRVTYVAHDDVMADCGIEKVKYRCANGGDSRTCKVCLQYNDEIFERGTEPQLPIHPNCRCLYVAEVEDTFKDNELNELTQSVRGAENYEKWKEAQTKSLNSDKDSVENKVKANVDKERQKEEAERKNLENQIDLKKQEKAGLQGEYATELAEIEAKKAERTAYIEKGTKEYDELEKVRDSFSDERIRITELFYDGDKSLLEKEGIRTEEDLDKRIAELRQMRKATRDKMEALDNALVAADTDIDMLNLRVKEIEAEIEKRKKQITADIKEINKKVSESLQREADLALDIAYVGKDQMRLDHIEDFRKIRVALRENKTFDFDTYKNELVKMAQRMDEDALTINAGLSDIVKNNLYNSYNRSKGAHYSPAFKRVHMKMDSNTHEKALGNKLNGSWQTKYHEEGHQLDHLLFNVSEITGKVDNPSVWDRAFTASNTETGKLLQKAINEDCLEFVNSAIMFYNDENKGNGGKEVKLLNNFNRIPREVNYAFRSYIASLTSGGVDRKASCQLGIISDALGLWTKDRLGRNSGGVSLWGHDSKYNKDRDGDGSSSETWATFCALRTCGSEEEQRIAKTVMPKTWAAMDEVYHKVAEYVRKNKLSY